MFCISNSLCLSNVELVQAGKCEMFPTLMSSRFYDELDARIPEEPVYSDVYANMIGSLLLLANHTRPDISCAVGIICQYTSKPTTFLIKAVHRVFGYLRMTAEYGIVFEKEKKPEIIFYCDSDYAGSKDSRKSRTGWCAIMNGGGITWSSHKQNCVALSTAKAESVALSECSKEIMWIRNFITETGRNISTPYILRNDNTAAEYWSNSERSMKKAKHIDVRYHNVRQCIAEGSIETEHVDSSLNWSDGFSKPLPKDKFRTFRNEIGLSQIVNNSEKGQAEC